MAKKQEQQEEVQEIKNIVKVEDIGPCKKKVTVEVPEVTIKKAADEQYETLRKDVLVPGFRKGRAPRRLLEKKLGKEAGEQIKLKILADASDTAMKDNKINALREPEIDYKKIELPEKGDFKFDFEVEVRPEFELPNLEGIVVNKPKLEVTDEQVKEEIQRFQKYAGTWAPKENGKIETDDQVITDVMIKPEEGNEEKINNIELYSKPFGYVGDIPVENLNEVLNGAKTGDTKETTVEVPKTYFKEEYRGKKVTVKIDIKDIKHLKLAELNEDFFARMGVASEQEMHDKVKEMLQGRIAQKQKTEMNEQVYKYLSDNTTFDLPVAIVADQATLLLRRQYANMLRQGLSVEKIDEKMEELKSSSEEQANQQLKTFFIMDKVSEKLGVEVTDEEVNGFIAQMAIQRNQRPERMKEEMTRDGSLEQFRLDVRDEKSIEKILEKAQITEVEPEKKTESPKKAAKKKEKTEEKAEKAAEPEEKKAPKRVKKSAKKETEE
jgi:trigger factor